MRSSQLVSSGTVSKMTTHFARPQPFNWVHLGHNEVWDFVANDKILWGTQQNLQTCNLASF